MFAYRLKVVALYLIVLAGLVGTMGAIRMTLVAPTLPALVADNDEVDNGPAITAWVRAGKPLPRGMYYVSTTITTSYNVPGMRLVGQGMPDSARANGNWDIGDNKPITILIWNGAANGTLVELRSGTFYMADIGLQGVDLYNAARLSNLTQADCTATLFKMYQADPPPPKYFAVGDNVIERVLFSCGRLGIYASGDDHCDHTTIRDVKMEHVETPIKCVERQSVEWIISAMTCVAGGGQRGDCIFDFERGGRLKADITALGPWDALIKLPIIPNGEAAYNSGLYDIFVFFDVSTDFTASIVERDDDENAACAVNIHGYSSADVNFPDPIPLNAYSEFTINVQRVATPTKVNPDFIYPDEP